jgi:hypothetical protein
MPSLCGRNRNGPSDARHHQQPHHGHCSAFTGRSDRPSHDGLTKPPTSINTLMNSTNNDRPTSKQQLRESLTKEILADIEYEVDDVLTWAPESLTEKDRKAIRDEVIAQTRHVTDALTTEELQNDGARRAYTCRAVADTRYLVNVQMAQGEKG